MARAIYLILGVVLAVGFISVSGFTQIRGVVTSSGGSSSFSVLDGIYLYNISKTIWFNETKLNGTIDARAGGICTDCIFSSVNITNDLNVSGLVKTGQTINQNGAERNVSYTWILNPTFGYRYFFDNGAYAQWKISLTSGAQFVPDTTFFIYAATGEVRIGTNQANVRFSDVNFLLSNDKCLGIGPNHPNACFGSTKGVYFPPSTSAKFNASTKNAEFNTMVVKTLNTGSNAGTDLCIDANNKICACGTCA